MAKLQQHLISISSSSAIVTLVSGLIDQIEALSRRLPSSIPNGSATEKINHVMTKVFGLDKDSESSTFTRRMDILFGSDCRNELGHFRYVTRGKHGMGVVIQYLCSIDWKSTDISFTVAAVKLTAIVKDLEVLCLEGATGDVSNAASPISMSSLSTSKRMNDAGSDSDEAPPKKRATRNGTASVEDVNEVFQPHETIDVDDSSGENSASDSESHASKKPSTKSGSSKRVVKDASRRRATKKRSDPTALGADGMLADINVQPIPETSITTKLHPAADVNHFFSAPFTAIGVRGVDKLHRTCKLCNDRTIADLSTNRRHLGKYHADAYRKWASDHDFESRLEADVKVRKEAAESVQKLQQQKLDSHLREKPPRVVPYSDKLFREAALE
ncbi:putative AC transposase [Mycena sanguinolenta]|uniref:Putative AC transposase n=1 Tax=Mycena sanguinolenta TaxID=230812 RepID=A0A8H6TS61_9AGAR|nr:putative AC transposase [Mycena sanguinolenta]